MSSHLLPHQIILPILLSMSPFFELRGGIILAIAYGYVPEVAFIVGVLANSFAVFIIFFGLDLVHERMMKYNWYKKRIDWYIEKYRHKFQKTFSKRETFLYLFSLTAIPLPFTGAYTASLLAWLFNVQRRIAYTAIITGITVAGLLITLATVGVIRLF